MIRRNKWVVPPNIDESPADRHRGVSYYYRKEKTKKSGKGGEKREKEGKEERKKKKNGKKEKKKLKRGEKNLKKGKGRKNYIKRRRNIIILLYLL